MMRLIAKHGMEGLAAANRRAYTSPSLLALWFAVSSAFVEYMHWWPSQQAAELKGFWPWLSPIRGYAPFLVVLLVAADWFNRPHFEDRLQATLRAEDMRDPHAYYAQPLGSGLWLLDYDNEIIGLAAVKVREPSSATPTPTAAALTHFTVIEPYRPANIQRDLLQHALRQAFHSNGSITSVYAEDDALCPYTQRVLREEGFRTADSKPLRRMGFMRWQVRECVLMRDQWDTRQSEVQGK